MATMPAPAQLHDGGPGGWTPPPSTAALVPPHEWEDDMPRTVHIACALFLAMMVVTVVMFLYAFSRLDTLEARQNQMIAAMMDQQRTFADRISMLAERQTEANERQLSQLSRLSRIQDALDKLTTREGR